MINYVKIVKGKDTRAYSKPGERIDERIAPKYSPMTTRLDSNSQLLTYSRLEKRELLL